MTLLRQLSRNRWANGLVLLFGWAGIALAQFSGDIQVEVKDATGSTIPGASVTIRSDAGATRTAAVDNTGQARFTQLSIGEYQVTVTASGFANYETKVTVDSGKTIPVPVTLGVQKSQSTVMVSDQAAVLNTENSQLQQTTEAKSIEQLPIVGNGILALAGTTPGVIPVAPNNPYLGLGSFNSNGGRGRSNNITVDGANATDVSTTGSAGLGTVPLDAIAEFNIITNNFQAQYGRNSSAQVQIFTKSGTNEFHGDLFEFLANNVFNARDYFDRTGGATPIKNNRWGATAGLPILKNKLFAFGTYEQQKIRGSGSTAIATVPTPAQVSAATDPTALALLRRLQVPTSPTGTVSNAAPNLTNVYAYSGRVDWNITGNDVFYTRVGTQNNAATSAGNTFINSNLPTNGASSQNISYNATMSETHTFSPAVVNVVLFAFGRSAPFFSPLANFGGPQIDFRDGTSTFGIASNIPQGRVQNTFNLYDTASWHVGRHSFMFGGQMERIQANSVFDSNVRGTYTFSTLPSFLAGQPPSLYTQRFGNSVRGNRLLNQGYFAQDDYRIASHLTLNLGVRLEVTGPVSEVNNILSNLNLDKHTAVGGAGPGPLGAFDVGKGAQYFHRTYNWEPSVGFAWNPGGGKLVMRGGYRIAYDFIFLNPITNGRFLPPYMYLLSLGSTDITGANSFANLAAGTSAFQAQGAGLVGNFGTNVLNFGGISPVDQNLKNSQVQQYSYTLERQLPMGLFGRISYVGTLGRFLTRSRPINLIARGVVPSSGLTPARALAIYNASNTGPGVPTNRIDPRFTGVTLVESSANSNYNGLEVTVEKRLNTNYIFTTAYTWSKSIDDNSDVLNVLETDVSGQQNPLDNRNNRAVSAFDAPHRLVITNVFTPKYGKNIRNAFLRTVLGDWELSGIFQAQSGFPLNLLTGSYQQPGSTQRVTDPTLLGGSGNQRPDLVGPLNVQLQPDPGSANRPNLEIGSGLVAPGFARFGSLGRNVLRENPLIESDLTLGKTFNLTERIHLEYQAQVLNVFNNTTFSRPGMLLSGVPTFGYYQNTDTDSRNMVMTLRLRW